MELTDALGGVLMSLIMFGAGFALAFIAARIIAAIQRDRKERK